jgi:hypothetical protein
MRRANPYRQIELAQSLASNEPVISIVKRLSAKWKVNPRTIYVMLSVLRRTRRKVSEPTNAKLPDRDPRKLTLHRMRLLEQAMKTDEPRKSIVQRFSQAWAMRPESVDRLIKRALATQRDQIDQELREARQQLIQRKRDKLTQARDARDHEKAAKTFVELSELMGLLDPEEN